MVSQLDQIRLRTPRDNSFLGLGELPRIRESLARLPEGASKEQRCRLHWALGLHLLRLGETERAIEQLNLATHHRPAAGTRFRRDEVEQLLLHRAVAYMRLAETQNCVNCRNSESCLLPLAGGGVHRDPTAAQEAGQAFLDVLKLNPQQATARWLLNVVAMAAGEFPERVPSEYLISPDRFRSDEEFPRFPEVARELGVAPVDLCGGTIVDDFDGDLDFDIVVSTWDTAGPMHYFENHGDGTFVERTEAAGLQGLFGGLNMIHGDYDNDGDLDVLVLRGAWWGDQGRHPYSLLQNDGSARFRDVTFDCGLGEQQFPAHSAAFADFDNDGDLDLYIGHENDFPSELWKNDGSGRFENVAVSAGVENRRFVKGVTWGDFNNDRLPDLYVSNFGGANRLYRNDGNGKFTDVAPRLGVTAPEHSFATWFWDYNNDGSLDLYVASYVPRTEDVAREFLEWPQQVEYQALYEGTPEGTFRNVTAERGLDRVAIAMGANFGDLDNDGFLDFYLGTGAPEYEALMPNLMFSNQQGGRFANVSSAGGFGHLQKGHGVAFADLDQDGDQDVYVQVGGAFPGDAFGNALFENPGFGRHWLSVRLIGVTSNRWGVGARLRADFTDGGVRRSLYRWVNAGGSFGDNPLRQHLGLGSAAQVDRLEVYWPTSGTSQEFSDVRADQILVITEGVSELQAHKVPAQKLTTRSGR